jgi:hypothetical protein
MVLAYSLLVFKALDAVVVRGRQEVQVQQRAAHLVSLRLRPNL